MKASIDRAGRLVIPARIRNRLGLVPGAELHIEVDDVSIRLIRQAPRPKLVRVGRRWVARPTAPKSSLPRVDVARLIEEERDRWPL
jgi:AbrB family looped-hinge helix DNA binding protein